MDETQSVTVDQTQMVTAPDAQVVSATEPQPAPEPLFQPSAKSVFDLFSSDKKPEPAKVEAPPATPAGAAADLAKPPEPTPPATEPTLESLMAEFRELYPEASDSIIKRFADKELHIKKQSGQISDLLKRVTEKPAQRSPTPFELSLQPIATPPPAQPATQPAAVPTVAPAVPAPAEPMLPPYMASRETAYAALYEAVGNGDYPAVAEIQGNIDAMNAYTQRQEIEALAERKAKAAIQQQFGHILPTLQQQAAEQQANEILEFAVGELEARGVAGIREMFSPTDDTVIEADGGRWANTPMNRAMATYPILRQIQVQHPDRTTARKLTSIARYELAARLMAAATAPVPTAQSPAPTTPVAATGITPEQAQALVQAGREQAQREEQDRIRAAMNGGRLPAGAADGKDQVGRLTARSGSWVDMFRTA